MRRSRNRLERLLRYLGSLPPRPRKRPPRPGGELEREPVEPPRPNTLSGGAAAELEYDD